MNKLSVKELIRELSVAADKAIVEVAENDWGYDTDAFHDTASPENIKALLAYVAELEFIRDSAHKLQKEYSEELGCASDNESIMSAIDEIRHHIAELESRRVALPKEYVCYHGGPCGDDFREPCYLKDSVLLMLKLAGIECEVV